ncbi:MAG: chemotaxis protein CheX [Gammaproteobacteria bacterium]|nr:chemotaxis protein CheX [Gammaproteobacteria bacterium]MCK5091624.1 chemotaxis protein CheX [Gammaproteobacteria bacterium]
MEAKYINPVLEAMMNVLKTMAKVDPKPGKLALKNSKKAYGDVTGIMAMVSDKAKGSLAITFTKPAILDIAKRMLGEDFTEINDMVTDLTGEITNMVTGGAKAIFESQGHDFNMSLPTVISGENHSVEHKSDGPTIVLPFSIEAGDFFIEVCFE